MYRPRLIPPRRGVILLVVASLLTLFAVVGLGFVFYAAAHARAAQLHRDAETRRQPRPDPELLFSLFLGQLLYDVPDDEAGVYSALRGHSLARGMYGADCRRDPAAGRFVYADERGEPFNATPFNGAGRLHTGPPAYPSMNPFGIDDYRLVNYTFFRDDPQASPGDRFLRDPERLAPPGAVKPWRTRPEQRRGPFAGGFNAPYTYPDLNNLFLAAVRADGTLLTPSFHREWLFGRLDERTNPNWSNTEGKYLTLRPRPADHVADDATRPVRLGAEVGRAEGRHVRHRMFAVVDRSALTSNPGPQPHFNPRAAPAPGAPDGPVVPYFSIID